jgi:hypothetical protein
VLGASVKLDIGKSSKKLRSKRSVLENTFGGDRAVKKQRKVKRRRMDESGLGSARRESRNRTEEMGMDRFEATFQEETEFASSADTDFE